MYFAKHNHHSYFINVHCNIHYGIYRTIKINLFRYPIETDDSKNGVKEKKGRKNWK